MKTFKSLSTAALVVLLPVAVAAQTSAPSATDRTTGSGGDRGTMGRASDRPSKPERQAWSNTEGLHETGDLVGTTVQDAQGKNIGKISALLIEPKDGKVSHAVISLGGVMGVGAERVVVAWSDLKMSGHRDGKKATVSLDQATLDRAPKYVKAQERQPSASPATRRTGDSGTTYGSGASRDAANPSDPKTDKR